MYWLTKRSLSMFFLMKVKNLFFCLISLTFLSVCRGEGEVPVHIVGKDTYIQDWLICGAFPNHPIKDATNHINRTGYDTDFLEANGGEAVYTPSLDAPVSYEGKAYQFKRWNSEKNKLDIRTLYDDTYKVAYLFAWLKSEADQDVFFHLGSDDGVKVYMNGEPVHSFFGDRGAFEHNDIFAARLRKGLNPLLVKIEQGKGGWGLVLEVMAKDRHFEYLQQNFDRYVQCDIKQSGIMGEKIVLSLSAKELIGDTKVIWTVSDPNAQIIQSAENSSMSEISFSIPPRSGFYHIAAELPEMGIQRVYTCLLHETPMEVANNLSDQAIQLINDPSYAAYAGWLEYLRWKFMHRVETKKPFGSNRCRPDAGPSRLDGQSENRSASGNAWWI